MLHEWISQAEAIDAKDNTAVGDLVGTITSNQTLNLVAEYTAGQKAAKEYLDDNKPIPPGLVKIIQELGNAPSGFTGLTVFEAYSLSLRLEK